MPLKATTDALYMEMLLEYLEKSPATSITYRQLESQICIIRPPYVPHFWTVY